ncbi:hypothetical protein [Sphingobacterium sp. 2149]|uniref:hypothetical protein n=1 Tax=Sphingobacterium sp. 2149 TaxID=2817763 RepID=UPI001AE87E9F|nr:hypothetical protein [Sphingobacterium sp. 2149]MDR6735998.1 hypothetical protein [Sphingobacterium sp. 2149]
MEDKRLKELKDKYFNGQSSLEEEKELKNSEDFFFQSLNEEKNLKMEWSFEDFESNSNESKKGNMWWNDSWIKYAAAAVLLMSIGLALFLNQQSAIQSPLLAEKEINDLKPADNVPVEHQSTEIVHPHTEDRIQVIKRTKTLQTAETVKRPRIGKQTESRAVKKEVATESLESETSYQADYVVLNGKPVANEQEAVELTLKSLGLLANNLENGVDKAMNIKQMSITIN